MKTVRMRMLYEAWIAAGEVDGRARKLSAGEVVDVPEDTAARWALYGWAVLADSEGAK
jgi:hypothetical protein